MNKTTLEAAPDLVYANLREANVARQAAWCPEQIPDLSFRGNELAGETGEVCNVVKKLERERLGWRGSRDTVAHLAEELADVVICADLVALSAGINLDAAVEAKFNATSEKVGLPHRLRRSPAPAPAEGVTVRPLRWPPTCPRGQRVHGHGSPFNAEEYSIAHYGGDTGDAIHRWAANRSSWSEPCATYEQAKAAAQADYAARIRSALLPSESAKKAGVVGWLFLNPDSGYEFSPNHPVESGECEDAENIRPATAKALLDELLSAWDAAHEFEGQLDQIARESASQRKALIDAEDALASIAGERTPKKFPQTSYEIAAKVLPAVRAVLPASPSPATGEA